MADRFLIWTGGSGAVFAGVCCFTPVLPIVLGTLGLGALGGYIYRDMVLLPLLAFFLLLFGIGLWVRHRRT